MEEKEKETITCKLFVEFDVFTDDPDVAIENAERLLLDFLEGTDFANFTIIKAEKNYDY